MFESHKCLMGEPGENDIVIGKQNINDGINKIWLGGSWWKINFVQKVVVINIFSFIVAEKRYVGSCVNVFLSSFFF